MTYGYETKYKRIQILELPKSHTNDAIAIACAIGEVVKPRAVAYHIRCISRGQYQLHNGKRSEHKVWAPRKVKGWKLYELVKVKGRIGYIGGRRIKGAFVVKDLMSGKAFVEVTPSKLERLARPVQGWIITRLFSPQIIAKEGGASSPSEGGDTRAAILWPLPNYRRLQARASACCHSSWQLWKHAGWMPSSSGWRASTSSSCMTPSCPCGHLLSSSQAPTGYQVTWSDVT